MSKRKETRPGADTPRRATMEAETGKTTASKSDKSDFTIPASVGQAVHIADLLSHGAENGVGLQDLVSMTGLSEREVRQIIRRERLAGVPVLSDNLSGYFLPGNTDEIVQCAISLRSRAHEILRTANAIAKACNSEALDGQIFLDGSF